VGQLFRPPLYQSTESRPAGTTFRGPAGTTCPTVPRQVVGVGVRGATGGGFGPPVSSLKIEARACCSEALPIVRRLPSIGGSKPPPSDTQFLVVICRGSLLSLSENGSPPPATTLFSFPAEISSPARGLWSTFSVVNYPVKVVDQTTGVGMTFRSCRSATGTTMAAPAQRPGMEFARAMRNRRAGRPPADLPHGARKPALSIQPQDGDPNKISFLRRRGRAPLQQSRQPALGRTEESRR
jgi:hypothetical protein